MSIWGRAGVFMATVMALYIGANAARAWAGPDAFAAFFGVPVQDTAAIWVQVYALRAAFIALLLFGLILSRAWAALFVVSIAALVMPLGDAWLTHASGAPVGIYMRHMLVAVVILIAAILLGQAAATARREG